MWTYIGMSIVSGIIGYLIYYFLTKRYMRKAEEAKQQIVRIPCDTCIHLQKKYNKCTYQHDKYICAESGSFNDPPEICGNYESKETDMPQRDIIRDVLPGFIEYTH